MLLRHKVHYFQVHEQLRVRALLPVTLWALEGAHCPAAGYLGWATNSGEIYPSYFIGTILWPIYYMPIRAAEFPVILKRPNDIQGPEKLVCRTYLRKIQAGPSKTLKEQQQGISPNHVWAVNLKERATRLPFSCLPFSTLPVKIWGKRNLWTLEKETLYIF